MKNIHIKSLELINFKGIKNIQFSDLGIENFIYGANGVGKTTLFDSFIWLLFGKDSQGRSDYEIKPLDENNQTQKQIDNVVKATLLVNNEEVTLSRTYKEKWTKQRGALEKVFTGNVTEYTFNEVPVSKKEYDSKISQLVDEKIFKLITNPYAFENLKWQDKREVLVGIVGEVNDEEILNSSKEFETLKSKLSNKSLDEYDKQLKASIKKSKEEQESIPSRVDEVYRQKPDATNFIAIENQISDLNKEVEKIDALIENKSKSMDEPIKFNNQLKAQLYALEMKENQIIIDLRTEAKNRCKVDTSVIDGLITQIKNKEEQREVYLSAKNRLISEKEYILNQVTQFTTEKNSLVNLYKEEQARQFDVAKYSCICPECSHQFVVDHDAEIQFNQSKVETLKSINTKGSALKSKIEELQQEVAKIDSRLQAGEIHISDITDEIKELQNQIDAEQSKVVEVLDEETIYNELFIKSKEYAYNAIEIEKLNKQFKPIVEVDNSELKAQKQELLIQIDALKQQLNDKVLIEKAEERINELKAREKVLSQQIADLEREQFSIDKFKKVKSESLEKSVNRLFKYVTFKLFETQVNGAEVPTCQALINGVPFSTANLASQINAGIDIINTLCKAHRVTAPLFLDNRESVTNLISTSSQIINLIVSPNDKQLRLENNVKQLEVA